MSNVQVIFSISVQIITTVVSVITVVWRIQTAQHRKHLLEIEAIKGAFKEELDCVKGSIREWEELRRNGDHALHERINNVESGAYKEINTRLSHIEGQLKGINNITRLMEDWLIKNGGKVE